MANQEHLALIQEDVLTWNNWYKKHKKVIPDLSYANLSNINLSGINLKRANLNHANLSNTDLSNAQLDNANLERANFLGADLQDTSLKGANLDFVIFSQAKINSKTIISDKHRSVYNIVNNKQGNKDFTNLDLSNSNLFRADLNNANLSNTKLINTNLASSNLKNAYLYRADLTKANLQNANLRNAYFSQANLTSANLASALCCGAYFKSAELRFANFKATKLSHKTLIDLKWYTVWEIVNRDAVRKNLSGLDLSHANFQGVNFTEANLTNTNLSHAILSHSNLESADLTNTDLAGADIRGVDLELVNLNKTKLVKPAKPLGSALNSRSNPGNTPRDPAGSNVMVKERPIVETDIVEKNAVIQFPPVSQTSEEVSTSKKLSRKEGQSKLPKKRKKINIIPILFLGVLGCIIAGGYVFNQNSDFTWQPLKQKLEQMIPAR